MQTVTKFYLLLQFIMKTRQLLILLITMLATVSMQAQQQIPKLVVFITIDQLRGDYLDYFKGSFGERGFKRLLNEGIVYKHVQFEFPNLDRASAGATLFTGSNPCYHSITGVSKYDFDKESEQSCLYDANYLGNYTHQHFSPKNLLSSTVGDELKIASKGASLVFGIAPEAENAIISAGHTADGAFWIDDYNGKWATTTFYKGIPAYVDKLNSGVESLSQRLPSLSFEPMLKAEQYGALPYIADKKPYKYTFNEKEVDCYPRFKTSPLVNSEVARLATQFVTQGDLGSHTTADMLNITFYAGNFADVMDKSYTQEVQDIYYQLDKSIEQVLDAIDKKIGLNKTLIIVTGTGYYTDDETVMETKTSVGGTFHPKRCTALLNMYLMAIYGQKNWVKGYYNKQIYLNRKTIEDEKVDLIEIQNKAAEFVAEFSGVQQAVADNILRSGDWNEGSAAMRYGTYHIGRGDIIIELQPGWGVEDEQTNRKTTVKRNNIIVTPVIFFGNGLRGAYHDISVYATEIAPTITKALRIKTPNACSDIPLF